MLHVLDAIRCMLVVLCYMLYLGRTSTKLQDLVVVRSRSDLLLLA